MQSFYSTYVTSEQYEEIIKYLINEITLTGIFDDFCDNFPYYRDLENRGLNSWKTSIQEYLVKNDCFIKSKTCNPLLPKMDMLLQPGPRL